MSVPRVSVCIPTYNRAGLLQSCLQSILSQTHGSFEIVVSDNCSTDETRDVVADCSDSRIRYYRNEANVGPYPNMNRLLERARGEYLSIAHDDDLYAPEYLSRQAELIDRHPNVGMVHCAVREIDEEGMPRQLVRAYRTTRILERKREFIRYLAGHNVCCSTVMARRKLLVQAGGFDVRYLCADFLMWMKLALQAEVAYVAEPLVGMRVHRETVTNWLDPERWHREFVAILEEGFALGTSTYPDLQPRREALFRVAALAQGRRFLIATLAAISRGEYEHALGYVSVLEKLEPLGLPPRYARAARALDNGFGRRLLAAVARMRRAKARRAAVFAARRAA